MRSKSMKTLDVQTLEQWRKWLSYFEKLAPSYQRMYIGWIDSAKQEATRMRRLEEAISLLSAGRKLGLK